MDHDTSVMIGSIIFGLAALAIIYNLFTSKARQPRPPEGDDVLAMKTRRK